MSLCYSIIIIIIIIDNITSIIVIFIIIKYTLYIVELFSQLKNKNSVIINPRDPCTRSGINKQFDNYNSSYLSSLNNVLMTYFNSSLK